MKIPWQKLALFSGEWPQLSPLHFSSESLPEERTESVVGMDASSTHGSVGPLITAVPVSVVLHSFFFAVIILLYQEKNHSSRHGPSGAPSCHHLLSDGQTYNIYVGRGDRELNNRFYYLPPFAKALSLSFSACPESLS